MKQCLKVIYLISLLAMCSASFALSDRAQGIFTLAYKLPKPPGGATASFQPFKLDDVQCRYQFEPIIDARLNKQTIGASTSRPLQANGVEQWLTHYQQATLTRMATTSTDEKGLFNVKTELLRLYTYDQGTSIFGVMAVRLEIGDSAKAHYIRGYSTSPNWAGALSEYGNAVTNASHDLAQNMTQVLRAHCASI